MEKTLLRLCEEHALRTISVMLMTDQPEAHRVTVYVHWNEGDDRVCESGSGTTFDAAMDVALTNMRQSRYAEAA